MGFLHIRRRDRTEVLTQRGGNHLLVNQCGNAVQKLMLSDHIPGSKHRAGKHKLPVQGDALRLHGVNVSGGMMSDDAEVICRLAVSGAGVAYKSRLDVAGVRLLYEAVKACCEGQEGGESR